MTESPQTIGQLPARWLFGVLAAVVAVLALVAAAWAFDIDGGGTPPTTAPPTTAPPTTAPPTEVERFHVNPAGLDLDGQADAVPDADGDAWLVETGQRDNGPSPQGQFRLSCVPAFWARFDPVVFPGLVSTGHLHMFFGAFDVSPDSTGESLAASGATSCRGGPHNRSAYWMPALQDANGDVLAPFEIVLYYKSHRPDAGIEPFPEGVELTANLGPNGVVSPTHRASERVHWGCYNGASSTDIRPWIPGAFDDPCPTAIQATLQFSQCIAVDGDGDPLLSSDNLVDHDEMLFDEAGNYGRQRDDCPPSHPYRVPQLSYLVRWATVDADGRPIDTSGWRLSSDHLDDGGVPGGSLHGDYIGAWSEPSNELWLRGCFDPDRPLNCSQGQTGTALAFGPLVGRQVGTEGLENQTYVGPQTLPVAGFGP